MLTFAEIVDSVSPLSIEEIEEMKKIISEILIEKKRDHFLAVAEQAKKDSKEGKLKFYDNVNDLMKSLNEPD